MSADKPGRGSDQFILRFPDGMRDRIRVEADKNGRSMNSEIIDRLEKTLREDGVVNHELGRIQSSLDSLKAMLNEINARQPPAFTDKNDK